MDIDFDQADIDRFLSYVEVLDSGCWFWTGARSRGEGNKKWYGSFRIKDKATNKWRTVRAHAFACAVAGKVCPPGHHRDHQCNFSLCVCPDHFECVTREINQGRKVARVRLKPSFNLLGQASGSEYQTIRTRIDAAARIDRVHQEQRHVRRQGS